MGRSFNSATQRFTIQWIPDDHDLISFFQSNDSKYSNPSNQSSSSSSTSSFFSDAEEVVHGAEISSAMEALELITDFPLARIQNVKISQYFIAFDCNRFKFIPSIELAYLFPLDCEPNGFLNGPDNGSFHGRRSGALNGSFYGPKTHLQSVDSVYNHIHRMATSLRRIIAYNRFEPQIHAVLLSEVLQESRLKQVYSLVDQILVEIERKLDALKGIEVSSDFKSQIHFLRSKSFSDRREMEGKSRDLYKMATFSKADILTENLKALLLGRLLVPESVHEIAHKTVGIFLQVYDEIKQLLRYRYQNVGFNELENALAERVHRILNRRGTPLPLSAYPNNRVIELKESSSSSSSSPLLRFTIGQRVKHSKYGYRGVVVGWDQRPVTDTRGWEDVQETSSLQEQPFYRIVSYPSTVLY